jgi:hypothetical protein
VHADPELQAALERSMTDTGREHEEEKNRQLQGESAGGG